MGDPQCRASNAMRMVPSIPVIPDSFDRGWHPTCRTSEMWEAGSRLMIDTVDPEWVQAVFLETSRKCFRNGEGMTSTSPSFKPRSVDTHPVNGTRSSERGPTSGVVEFPGMRRRSEDVFVPRRRCDPLTPTVFHEAWWLETATDGNHREATVEHDGRVVGRMPYVVRRTHAGGRLCTMPEMTHFLGPAVDPGDGSSAGSKARVARITRELVRKLPVTSAAYHKVHANVSDMLPFQEVGYDVGVQFTFEIPLHDEERIWKAMKDKTRNVIRSARKKVRVSPIQDPEEFVAFQQANLGRRGLINAHPTRMVARMCAEALRRGRGRIVGTRDASGRLTAAVFVVHDVERAYYLMSTRSPNAGNGDVSLLVWDSIVAETAQGRIFDFDGVGNLGSVNFFAGFGGATKPRYVASRYSLGQKALMLASDFRHGRSPRFY